MAVNSVPVNSVPLITGAIQQAARQTGVSFGYLLATAQIESNLNPSAQAPTSSAHGLYQFIEQTWLGTLKEGGAAHGYGRHADAITRLPDGRYEVADPGQRAAIMRLRSDPTASAVMAGTFARNNAAQLQSAIGRMPSEGELYIAHFLGAEGAGRLISAAANQPMARAADMFPQAAAANQRIFLDKAGRPRSASEVYATLTGRFDFARAASAAPVRSAMPVVALQPQAAQAVAAPPDPAAVARAYALAQDDRPVLPDTKPLFQAMFTDRLRGGTAPANAGGIPAATKTAAAASPGDSPVRGFGLFGDGPADSARLFNGKF
ncbi:MAG: transglycosylase SLT domain-containing protein [Pseudolabrys sp.]|nr:transglycosylase SLT domain-containing protein [Pseudolabrys sp.]